MGTTFVRDHMTSFGGYPRVSEDASLFDAAQALVEGGQRLDARGHRFMAVLVFDKYGKVIGKINRMDILTCLEPEYLNNEELKKVSRFGLTPEFLHSMLESYDLWKSPLTDICRKSFDRRVSDFIPKQPSDVFIDANATLSQAIHQLIMSRSQALLVLSDGEVSGLLRLVDVFDQVVTLMRACQI